MHRLNPKSAVLWSEYDGKYRPKQVRRVVSDGAFSGALVWRCESDAGPLCLRRWPARSPSPQRLCWIHEVIRKTAAAGFTALPIPIATHRGFTFVEHDEHLWELAPWLPGESDEPARLAVASSPARIAAAAQSLAHFHKAAAKAFAPLDCQMPTSVHDRSLQIRRLGQGGLERLERAVNDDPARWPELAERAPTLFDRVKPLMQPVMHRGMSAGIANVPLQPCLRDVHRDHVLFSGDRVTGIVDFGAMRVDTMATDVSRLLGSMAIEDEALWAGGIAAYEQVRPISDDERRLITSYHETRVVLSGVFWLRWVFVEHRHFENRRAVEERFDLILARLAALSKRDLSW